MHRSTSVLLNIVRSDVDLRSSEGLGERQLRARTGGWHRDLPVGRSCPNRRSTDKTTKLSISPGQVTSVQSVSLYSVYGPR